MLNPYYIYRHIRPDTDQVFYVGKGKNRRNAYSYDRSKATLHRSKFWQAVVAKNNGEFRVEIVMELDCPDKCEAKEKELIALYGRQDQGKGPLVNLTDGGDGSFGHITKPETREKLRAAVADGKHPNFGKKLSAETCRRKSVALQGEKHHLYGKKLPESWRKNIAKTKVGEMNPNFGKTGFDSPVSKQVKNLKTGVVYGSIAEAARGEGIAAGRLYSLLDGHTKKNPTDLVRI